MSDCTTCRNTGRLPLPNPERLLPGPSRVCDVCWGESARNPMFKVADQEPQPIGPSDDTLRQLWYEAGGDFHGPRIEHASIREALLFPFLRQLITRLPTDPRLLVHINGDGMRMLCGLMAPCDAAKMPEGETHVSCPKCVEILTTRRRHG